MGMIVTVDEADLVKKDEKFICSNRREEFRNSGKGALQIWLQEKKFILSIYIFSVKKKQMFLTWTSNQNNNHN